jgi:putative drug exporter of the RND superfamily
VQRSGDGDAALFTVSVPSPKAGLTSGVTRAVTAIHHAVQPSVQAAGGGLQAAVTGATAEAADSGSTTLTALLVSALVIVALILLLVYRSPILWLLPVICAVAALQVARAAAHGLATAGLTVSFLSSAILIILVFGAASDYALLLVHRYREELQRHTACEDAMATALRTTLPTLLASAATVAGAMRCLLAARSASLHALGPIGAVAIASAFAAVTTLLPALLLILGRVALWPRIPRAGAAGAGHSRIWAGIGGRWRLTATQRARLAPAVTAALAAGWAPTALAAFTCGNINGVRNPYAVLTARLSEAELSPPTRSPRPAWCGECDRAPRMLDFDGDTPRPCPRCKQVPPPAALSVLSPERSARATVRTAVTECAGR